MWKQNLIACSLALSYKLTKLVAGKCYALDVNAIHWMPYKVEQSLTNDEILHLASGDLEQ